MDDWWSRLAHGEAGVLSHEGRRAQSLDADVAQAEVSVRDRPAPAVVVVSVAHASPAEVARPSPVSVA